MKYIETHGLNLSRFQLGTVQLGMKYGLGVDCEKPSEEKAMGVLNKAMEMGLNTLDTSNDYGDSEVIIGRWLESRRQEGKELPWVVTKIGNFDHTSYDTLRDDILRQTESCQKNLGTDTLDCLMIHAYESYANDRDNVTKVFEELKAQNAFKVGAISVFSTNDYGVVADSIFDAVQIPLNVFDWMQIENGGIEKLEKSGKMIFARSVFLQGVVFHTLETLDPRMSVCRPMVKRYRELCEEFQLAPEVLALSFVLSVPGVAATVLGCDNAQQVVANCELFDKTVQLTKEQWNKLREAFVDVDRRAVTPGSWYDKK